MLEKIIAEGSDDFLSEIKRFEKFNKRKALEELTIGEEGYIMDYGNYKIEKIKYLGKREAKVGMCPIKKEDCHNIVISEAGHYVLNLKTNREMKENPERWIYETFADALLLMQHISDYDIWKANTERIRSISYINKLKQEVLNAKADISNKI